VGPTEDERAFRESWREELLEQTWRALQDAEQRTGQPCHTVLRLRADQPLLSSAELAQTLGARLGKPYSIDGLRQALHRARDKFADLLLEEVARSLGDTTPERLEEELTELGLLSYCRQALERFRLGG
jgi:hypothetical protein